MKPRQLDVELNTMILAASHSGRPHIVEKLKDLRTAMLDFTKQEEERGVKETALLAEVERVDRAAARIALETERLRRLRDEAMVMVRRVEPAALQTSPEDRLHLNKDLREAREVIFTDNYRDSDHSEDSEPRLTKMFPKSSQLRRHGSYGSLVPASPASRVMMPPAMPLIQNWGEPHPGYPGHYPAQFPPYPYMYGAPLLPPAHLGPPVYCGHHEDCQSQGNKSGGRRRETRQEADMSTDEGENTSNDAGDISSSDASGSGRRRKIKTSSPKAKLMPSHVNPADKAVRQPRKSDKVKPLRTSTPDRTGKISEDNIETNKVDDCQETKLELPPEPAVSEPQDVGKASAGDVKDKAEDSEDNLILDSDNSPEDLKLYSPESESSTKEEGVKEETKEVVKELVVEKKPSVSRERKVGVKRVEESDAYQQMLLGGVKKPPPSQSTEDDSTTDDIEAQVAVVSRPRNNFKAVTNSVHNLDEESLSEPEPAPVETLKLGSGGLGGHPVPLSLGGRLAHPAAHRVGMMALNNNNNNNNNLHTNTGANLSGPENDEDDDDFWS